MPKVKISEYSATANSNTDVASINIDEGCAPSGINNAIRAIMGHLKDFQQGTYGDPFNGPVNGTLGATTASTASVTTLTTSSTITHNGGTANGVAYLNGSKVLTTGSALTYDGTALTVGTNGLYLSGNTGGAAYMSTYAGSTATELILGTSGNIPIRFIQNNTEQMRLTSTSLYTASTINVGIGTSSPSSKLEIIGTNPKLTINANDSVNGRNATLSLISGSSADPSSTCQIMYGASNSTTSGTLTFVEGDGTTERMRIDYSGNFLVGTTTPAAGTARAYINGDATNPAFKALANTTTTSVYAGVFRHESTTAGAYIQFVTDGNVETGSIYDLAGTMQYASSSDARLKTNVQPMQNGLQSVLALNPCTFDMRRGEDTFISSSGLIAQEVHEVYPFVVGIGGDDENTNPWSVDYGKLTPLLVAAIQEQQALITQLTARITALEGA